MWDKNVVEVSMCYKNMVNVPGETIYEVITEEDGRGFGFAYALISKSEPHFHKDLLETYILMEGKLLVHLDKEGAILKYPLAHVQIPKGVTHWAEAYPKGNIARVLVFSRPAWTKKDHHKVDIEKSKQRR